MASLIPEYYELLANKKAIEDRIAAIEGNPQFAKEREFGDKLKSLMGEYDKSAAQVLSILDPDRVQAAPKSRRKRSPSVEKVYTNPHDGQQVTRSGGPFPQLMKEWIEKYGRETVDSWAAPVA